MCVCGGDFAATLTLNLRKNFTCSDTDNMLFKLFRHGKQCQRVKLIFNGM